MRNLQGIIFIWTRRYRESFKSALLYLQVPLYILLSHTKSTDVWKMWFIKKTVKMNGYSLQQDLLRNLVTNLFFWKFCFSLRTSYKELFCCTNNPNAHVCTFGKRFDGSFSLWVSLKRKWKCNSQLGANANLVKNIFVIRKNWTTIHSFNFMAMIKWQASDLQLR